MVRVQVLLWIMLSISGSVTAQGLATNAAERSATKMLAMFCASVADLPDEYAVVVRENKVSYTDGTKLDTVYLFSQHRRSVSSTRFSAIGYADQFINMNGEPRRWVQYLKTPTHRAQRQGGSAFGRYAGEIVEEIAMDPEDSRILRFPPGHDFAFVRPIAPSADSRLRRTHSAGYLQLLLTELDLMGAEKLDDGTIQSDWARDLWRVRITFDPKHGNSPTKIIHFSDLEIEEPGPIVCVHVVDWVEWKLEAGRTAWVPSHYRFRHSMPAFNSDFEVEGYLKWADTTEESVMPDLASEKGIDWREGIRERFDEDWAVKLGQWLAMNRKSDGSVPGFVE